MTIKEMNDRKRELGYSYEQIAGLSGVPLSTVRKVLGGVTKSPRYNTLKALSAVLQKSTSEKAAEETAEETVKETSEEAGKKAGKDPVIEGMKETAVPVSYHIREDTDMLRDSAAVHAWSTGKKQGEYTLEDYLALPDERRAELIDGVIYDMSAPTGYHQLTAGRLYMMIVEWISKRNGSCMPFISPVDVQLDCDDRTIVQPDVLILCDKSKYTPARIIGAPDFVAEILSKSTRNKDIFIKLNKYRNAGVREYWIIDPDKKKVMVWHFEKEDYETYTFRDTIPVGIYEGALTIDFAIIDDYITPWM
ncbi:MAG: Uma2 family endonuclease [Blautia sp.]|nr:Uma2 family endonuclease [Blautia sp.]